jgi:FkbM family methyltransferase
MPPRLRQTTVHSSANDEDVDSTAETQAKARRAVVPLWSTLKPTLISALLSFVIIGSAWCATTTTSPTGAPGVTSRKYRQQVFAADDPRVSACRLQTAASLAAVADLRGLHSFVLPAVNFTRGVRVRCWAGTAEAEPSPGDTSCERDVLGLPWPLPSLADIVAARGHGPVSFAMPTDDPFRVHTSSETASTRRSSVAQTASLELGPTAVPDYLSSRETVERYRFARASLGESTRPKLFVDVGPNGGYHTIVASLYGFDVLALEPLPSAAAALREAQCLNPFASPGGVTIVNFTAGVVEGECMLPTSSEVRGHPGLGLSVHACYSTLSLPDQMLRSPSTQSRVTVQHRRLDDLHLPYVTVVKVDVGFRSLAVLQGMERTLRYGGVEDPSAVAGSTSDGGERFGAEDDAQRQSLEHTSDEGLTRVPVTVVLIRVPLSEVASIVEFLWSTGNLVFWKDIGRGAIDTPDTLRDFVAVRQRQGHVATGVHLFARPKERVDVQDHLAALRASAASALERLKSGTSVFE